jgi:iron complex outermembrane receptor protein
MVPGLQVAHIDANRWVVTSRGFAAQFSGRLLVLMDGRAVYTPLFGGVYWDAQDLILEDIERIEVIRGPGASVWGANAVNGVINIITREAGDTPGGLASLTAGDSERVGSLRFSTQLGDDGADLRVYLRGRDHDSFSTKNGGNAGDSWKQLRGGFRLDWDPEPSDHVTLQGDMYSGRSRLETSLFESMADLAPVDRRDWEDLSGINVLARWRHDFGSENGVTLQSYYDRTKRDSPPLQHEVRDTFDIEFQHDTRVHPRLDLTWGLGVRTTRSRIRDDSFATTYLRDRRTDNLFTGFLQNEIKILDSLRFWIGTKVEHNDYTDWEVQPSARLSWALSPDQRLWAAYSHAVKTPTQADRDLRLNFAVIPPTPTLLSVRPGSNLHSSSVDAFEIGYRFKHNDQFQLDLSVFLNYYDDGVSREPKPPVSEAEPPPAHQLIAQVLEQGYSGYSHGVEAWVSWQVHRSSWVALSYTYLDLDLRRDPSSNATTPDVFNRSSPKHQLGAFSRSNLPWGLELDASLFFVDKLSSNNIASYTRFDLRLGYPLREGVDLSVGGRNLFESRHREFSSRGSIPSEVERNFYARITWRINPD